MLAQERTGLPPDELQQLRADLWDHGSYQKERDHVGHKLTEFRSRMEKMRKPVIDREYGRKHDGKR